jgi:NADH-quinone oxidoreductase subunit J
MTTDLVLFWILAPVSVAAAGAMVLSRNPVHAALWLIVNLFTLAVFFLLLEAPFLFAVQIIVYAGAIMVLFLFVIWLLGVDQQIPLRETIRGQRWLAGALAIGLVLEVFFAVRLGVGLHRGALPELVHEGGNVRALARVLFGPYFFPFEVTSVLLIVAALGAMLHGRRRLSEEEPADVPTGSGEPAEPPPAEGRGAPAGDGKVAPEGARVP